MNYKHIFATAVLLLLIIPFAWPSSEPHLTPTIIVTERPDSTLLAINKTSPKIELRGKLRPLGHALTFDTIINRDTVCVYIEPDSTIEIRLLPAPRIVEEWVKFIRRDSVMYQTATEFIDHPWYESPLLVVVGAALGFLIAILF